MAQEQEQRWDEDYEQGTTKGAPMAWDPSKHHHSPPTADEIEANRIQPVFPHETKKAEIVTTPRNAIVEPTKPVAIPDWEPTSYGSVYRYHCSNHLLKSRGWFESTLAVATPQAINDLCPRCHPGIKPIEVTVRPELPYTVEIDLSREGVGNYTALRQPSSIRRKYRLFGPMQATVRLHPKEMELTGSRIVEVRLTYRGQPMGFRADYRNQNLVLHEKLGEVLLRISSR